MTVACYARKSNDRKNDSIENQFSIIEEYISQNHELLDAEILHFSDEGTSGISMQREAFSELLTRVRKREIDCIVVKDLSRLGRNYLDVCKLTESILPFMGVRLIAISDNFDSKYRNQNTMDLPTAFTAVLNEYYSIEASKKISNSCRERIFKGEFIGKVPYGYCFVDKKTVKVNKEQAKIVREIFRLFSKGKSTLEIAKTLNERGVPTQDNSKWTMGGVRNVLKNENYIGKKISLKEKRDLKTKQVLPRNKNEWYVDENAFKPIVKLELFEKVQSMLKKGKRKDTTPHHIMANKLYCAGCGRTMRRNVHFYCRNGYVTGLKPCFEGSLKRDVLYSAVLEKVKDFIGQELKNNQYFSFSDKLKIQEEIINLKEKKADIFESFFANEIDEIEFARLNKAVSDEILRRQEMLKEVNRVVALNTKFGGKERPIDTLKCLYEADELCHEHMQFVKRINVFDAENFEIILESDSPLTVVCRNFDMFEEVIF